MNKHKQTNTNMCPVCSFVRLCLFTYSSELFISYICNRLIGVGPSIIFVIGVWILLLTFKMLYIVETCYM